MTKKKLKVMHEIKEVKTKKAQEVTAEPVAAVAPDPEVERVFEALRKLGGEATSPEICKELGLEPETGRDKVRKAMDKLHEQHRIHRTHEGRMYHYKLAEKAGTEPKAEVAEVEEAAA